VGRISYCDEEEYGGQFELWQANCRRSLQGKEGQAELLVLHESLLALPEKRLIYGSLVNEDGEVCGIGAYARHKGLSLDEFDPEYDTYDVGVYAGMPKLVAWTVVCKNDYDYFHLTPEQRYASMLRWVEGQLKELMVLAPGAD
jgi:hypothetical protein